MVETRSQKSSEGQMATLEVEIQPDPALDDNPAGRGTEGTENRILASESNPVEQGQDFVNSTATSTYTEKARKCRNGPISLLK